MKNVFCKINAIHKGVIWRWRGVIRIKLCFWLNIAHTHTHRAEEEGKRGWDLVAERAAAAAERWVYRRASENNANNGPREVSHGLCHRVNTITLWTRLPFKWKQTWNAKTHSLEELMLHTTLIFLYVGRATRTILPGELYTPEQLTQPQN